MAIAVTDSQVVLESCHSTWIFDTGARRFRRVLKGAASEGVRAPTSWQPYYTLELDESSESFLVVLNREGTRLLRSWRHLAHCTQCDGEATAELSVDELKSAVLG